MTEWYFFLAPLAVLAAVSLLHFVGCQPFGAAPGDDVSVETTPTPAGPEINYAATVKKDNPLSYWRLQEKHADEPAAPGADNSPVTGGVAKDEMGTNNGRYKRIRIKLPPPPPPNPNPFADSPEAPGDLALEAANLLDIGGGATSLSVDGGYVEIPFSLSLVLNSFTVEAVLRPEWSAAETGLFRTVMAFTANGPTPVNISAFGFALYAGPEDPVARTGPDMWQIWVGDGNVIQPIKFNHGTKPLVDFTKTNYVAVTYDDTTKKINLYTYVAGIELDNGPFNPVQDAVITYKQNTNATTKFFIATNQTPPGSVPPLYHPFKGRIQEVAVYNQALTYNRIVSHIGAGLNLV